MFGNKYKKQLEDLQTQYDLLVSENSKKAYQSSVAIDFKAMNAMSIERRLNESNEPITIIGYALHSDSKELIDWYIFCSNETHEKLVEEFKQYIKNKEYV